VALSLAAAFFVGLGFGTSASARLSYLVDLNSKTVTDLGTLGGGLTEAYGITDAGQVVGYSYTAGGDSHAFITAPDGAGMLDLNSVAHLPRGILEQATGINNAGQIIAIETIPEPESYPFNASEPI
jgi:probable HAF family extracellular repeat protein